MPLPSLCIESAIRYHAYLTETGKGCVVIGVTAKDQLSTDRWSLRLDKYPMNLDAIQFRIAGADQSSGAWKVESYDRTQKVLFLKLVLPWPEFESATAASIQIINDLKFLIRNVQRWFEENGNLIQIPHVGAGIKPTKQIPLRPDQLHAVEAVLAEPLTYVWGPPGTGKTRFVLAAAILAHLHAQNVVLVLAPTNNALDVAMAGVLEACKEADGDISKFLRLGSPGENFAAAFPEQCEVRGVEVRLNAIRNRLSYLEQLKRFRMELNDLRLIERLLDILTVCRTLVAKRDQLSAEANSRRDAILENDARAKGFGVKLFGGLTGASERISQASHELRRRVQALECERDAIDKEIDELFQQLRSRPMPCLVDVRPVVSQLSAERFALEGRCTYLQELFEEMRGGVEAQPALACDCQLEIEIQPEICQLGLELQTLSCLALDVRLQSVQVVGLTVDAYIGTYRDRIPQVRQIFIDEAAYTPLIKALTAFAAGVPVTLLGDHRQLPPVCEMTENAFGTAENLPAVLWSRSAMFCEHAIRRSEYVAVELYESPESPLLEITVRRDLTKSYRFGASLAKLLDELVYGRIGLTSGRGHDALAIEVHHAPTQPDGNWENLSQAIVGAEIAHRLGNEDWRILTPYTNQVKRIKSRLGRSLSDRVSTVHAAQGQEWSTVIFCACDTGRPFLTDSRNTKGRACLNTALSRVKRKLIIVLDVHYWRNRPDADEQLLSRLLQEAQVRG